MRLVWEVSAQNYADVQYKHKLAKMPWQQSEIVYNEIMDRSIKNIFYAKCSLGLVEVNPILTGIHSTMQTRNLRFW